MAMRCNIVCGRRNAEKSFTAGIFLRRAMNWFAFGWKLGSDRIHFYTGCNIVIYWWLGRDKRFGLCTSAWHPFAAFPSLIWWRHSVLRHKKQPICWMQLILEITRLLATYPVNLKRGWQRKDLPIVSGPGVRDTARRFVEKYPSIWKAKWLWLSIWFRGIGRYAGLRCIDVEGLQIV